MKFAFSCILFFLTILKSFAQDEVVANLFKVDYETPLTIEIKERNNDEPEIAPVQARKKKQNPKIFWGIKTKKGYAKTGVRQKTVTELFFYLKKKDYEGPDEYTRDFYYLDLKKKKIVNSTRITDPAKVGVLHGHYVKKLGDQVLEEGYFYKGKKHGRWMRYNSNDILQEKAIFWKGYPEQSLLSFYDYNRLKLKEAIPVHYGEKEGEYVAFHPNGNLAVRGTYKFDYRVGLWREYYENRRIKREIQYPDNPYSPNQTPFILREYGEDGKIIYDRKRFFNEGD